MHTSIKEEEVGARERVTIAFGGGGGFQLWLSLMPIARCSQY